MSPTPINPNEAAEREHHRQVTAKIAAELRRVHDEVVAQHRDMSDLKQQLQEQVRDLDHSEKANLRQAADMASRIGEHGVGRKRRLLRSLESPYFGRIDVRTSGGQRAIPVYIGVHSFSDVNGDGQVVYDWRAPLSSIFYDFELGEAEYEAPEGSVKCEISLKRQYRIEQQQFRFMLESSLNIQDDVLQEELSRASDDRLKNIVATIQRDQNAIIRNDHVDTLVIQGAAGSGKTSIALHRIAYLLYKYKDTISSDEILIVSPNKVFGDYISRILPELGEDMIRETTMESLAHELLDYQVPFQTFTEQVATLLGRSNPKFEERVRFKATAEFVDDLERYIRHVKSSFFRPSEIKIGFYKLDAQWISEQVRKRSRYSVAEQINRVVVAIVEHMQLQHQKAVVGKDRAHVRAELKKMFANTNLKTIYKNFYEWLGHPEMFKQAGRGRYEYSDVFPFIFLKLMFEGVNADVEIKHMIVDEMQDYTPIQYRVLDHLYPCKKTILGDRNQSVNPHSSSSAESIRSVLPAAECVHMNKSYRSTVQITRLAQSIIHNPDLVPIERHGELPQVFSFDTIESEIENLRSAIAEFRDSGHNSLGVICKTQEQADRVFAGLGPAAGVTLLDADSSHFGDGILVTTAYLAKGLEFDRVIVPFCDHKVYRTTIDRHMLYVACTRAMHRLSLSHSARVTPLLQPALDSAVATVVKDRC